MTATEPDEAATSPSTPAERRVPTTSNVNYLKGQTIPNAVIVGLGPTGTIDVFSFASSHVIVDVVGYFA